MPDNPKTARAVMSRGEKALLIAIIASLTVATILAILTWYDMDWFGWFFLSMIVLAFIASIPAGLKDQDNGN